MGQTFSRKQQTPEEVNILRKARTDYQDTLVALQTNVQTDIQKNTLTPETGKTVLDEIQKAYTWLQKNPNATLIEVYANRDSTTAEIKRLLTIDKPKREFQNEMTALPVIAEEAFSKELFSRDQKDKLTQLSATELEWLKKNGFKANPIDFQQETLKVKTSIQQILEKADLVQYCTEKMSATKALQPSALESELITREQKAKQAREATIHLDDGVNTIYDTALKTFFGFLLVTVCILGEV